MRVQVRWGRHGVAVVALMLVVGCAVRAATIKDAGVTPLQRAQQLADWGRLKEARTLLESARADAGNAKNAALVAFLGHVEVQFGDLKAARALTKEAVKIDDACASCHLYRFEAMARHAQTVSQFRAALALHGIKKQLEKAEELAPDMGDVQWGWIKFDLAVPVSLGGGSGDALKHADLLSRLNAVDGHLARASIYASEGKAQMALAEYRAAARTHPDDATAVFALGKALYQQADYAGAAGSLTRAWSLEPGSVFYGAYQAANLVRLQRPEKARAVLAKAQEEHPNSRLGDFLTAQALADTGQDAGWARQLLQRYLAVPPEPGQASAQEARKLLGQLSGN
ncbi:MAG: hypothetical protein ACRD0Y_05200 [Terriglobales bacterium]